MKRRSGATIVEWVLLVILIALVTIVAISIARQPRAFAAVDPEQNQPSYWCEDGFKVEWDGDVRTYVADADYDLVVIKAGQVNHVFEDVLQGDTLEVPKGISHIIFCERSTPSTTTTTTSETSTTTSTTTTSSTTTSVPEPTSTTTTVHDTTTTTETVESSTTTTTQAPSTTSTVPQDGSTTTSPTGSTTPSTPSESTAPPTITTLPHTGMSETGIALGIGLLVIGAAALMATRGMPDEDEYPTYFSWENKGGE